MKIGCPLARDPLRAEREGKISRSGGQCRTRTFALLLVRHGVQKSKCRFWCRLRGNPPLISPLNWTEDGLTSVPRATQDTRSAGRVSAWHTPLTRRSRTFDRVRKHYCVKED